jgi:glycosyltransferase involved in cell wall biosynthesis
MRRLLFVTQQVDPASPVLAATVPKVAALAERVDEVTVLALGGLPEALPDNVRVRTFGASRRVWRGVRFEAALAAELRRRPRPLAIVAHMCPIYAVLAAPLARPLRIPLLLWYTHWHATRLLRAATRLVDGVVSVDRRTFPLPSPKVRPIGHGIDLREFACRPAAESNGSLRVLALGRYSPAKGLDVVLRGLRLAVDGGLDARLEAHGPAVTELERAHRGELAALVEELGLAERVALEGPVPRSRIPELLGRSDVLVNNMRAGATDKVVYEACASCLPVVASNPAFDDLFAGIEPGLAFAREDAEELAARLAAVAGTEPQRRAELGRELRRRVEARHSVGSWADGVLRVVEELRAA